MERAFEEMFGCKLEFQSKVHGETMQTTGLGEPLDLCKVKIESLWSFAK